MWANGQGDIDDGDDGQANQKAKGGKTENVQTNSNIVHLSRETMNARARKKSIFTTTFYFRSARFIYIIWFEHANALPKPLAALRESRTSCTASTTITTTCTHISRRSHIITNCIRLYFVLHGFWFGAPKNTLSDSKPCHWHSVISSILSLTCHVLRMV